MSGKKFTPSEARGIVFHVGLVMLMGGLWLRFDLAEALIIGGGFLSVAALLMAIIKS